VRGFTIEPSKILVEVNSFPKNIYTPGSSNLTLTVRNSGDVPLKNVLVNVGTSAQLIPITPTTYYLGDLNPNESMNITLLIKATAVAGQTASLNVELQYSDITGKTYTQSRSLPVELTPVSIYN